METELCLTAPVGVLSEPLAGLCTQVSPSWWVQTRVSFALEVGGPAS